MNPTALGRDSMRWYLLTWTTYGSWLPGDERGFRTYNRRLEVPPPERYAKDESVYKPDKWRWLLDYCKQMSKGEVCLNEVQRNYVRKKISGIADEKCCSVKALHVGDRHVHVLIEIGSIRIPELAHLLKGSSSRGLSELGLRGRVWARGYHIRPVPDASVTQVEKYLNNH